MNSVEMRVFGLQRSGTHAIVNWIVQQSNGPTLFVNNVGSLIGNPLLDSDRHFFSASKSLPPGEMDAKELRRQSIEYMILGYEDTDLRHIPVGFSELLGETLGACGRMCNIVVIRDPFNLFASRIGFKNSANHRPMTTCADQVIQLWKIHARECLGHTRYLGSETIVVKFNSWFADNNYRHALAQHVGLRFTDKGVQGVPGVELPPHEFARFGCGSSFDRVKFHGRAQEMSVLTRWKRFVDDPQYLRLFGDPELLDLSYQLFGNITGTEILFAQ